MKEVLSSVVDQCVDRQCYVFMTMELATGLQFCSTSYWRYGCKALVTGGAGNLERYRQVRGDDQALNGASRDEWCAAVGNMRCGVMRSTSCSKCMTDLLSMRAQAG